MEEVKYEFEENDQDTNDKHNPYFNPLLTDSERAHFSSLTSSLGNSMQTHQFKAWLSLFTGALFFAASATLILSPLGIVTLSAVMTTAAAWHLSNALLIGLGIGAGAIGAALVANSIYHFRQHANTKASDNVADETYSRPTFDGEW